MRKGLRQFHPVEDFYSLLYQFPILVSDLCRPSQGKRINKQNAARIQHADNIITVFNHSSNAIDITLSQRHTALVFDRACLLFPNAERVSI